MHHDLVILQKPAQLRLATPEEINPDTRVGQDHRSSTLSRRTSSRSGIVPSSAARLRAASLSINAFKASRSSAVRSDTPLYSCALRNNSSSSDTVALMKSPCSLSTYYITGAVLFSEQSHAILRQVDGADGAGVEQVSHRGWQGDMLG